MNQPADGGLQIEANEFAKEHTIAGEEELSLIRDFVGARSPSLIVRRSQSSGRSEPRYILEAYAMARGATADLMSAADQLGGQRIQSDRSRLIRNSLMAGIRAAGRPDEIGKEAHR